MYKPTSEELYQFHNAVAAEDDNYQVRQMSGSHKLLYDTIKEILSHILPLIDSVLEVGCAEGLLTKWITDYYDVKVTGIDIAEDFINRCQEIPAKFIHTSIESFTMSDYDLVIATEVLEHCLNPSQIINRLSKHSRGILTSVPLNEPSINPETCSINAYRARRDNKRVAPGKGCGHASLFTPNTFRQLFNKVFVFNRIKTHGIILGI